MDVFTFGGIAIISIFLWLIGSFFFIRNIKNSHSIGWFFATSGTVLIIAAIAFLWIKMKRPPLRTLGETRLWYAALLSAIGLISYQRWKQKWLLLFSLGMASLFLGITLINVETFDKTLMPALQSPWFVPHVVVYILAYALLGMSSILSFWGLYKMKRQSFDTSILTKADQLVYMGFSLLTLGLLFGALWAKEAWGDYWTWDPKETWALLTWLSYLIYIHLRIKHNNHKMALWILGLNFILLLICWMGINYLPIGANSVHSYTN